MCEVAVAWGGRGEACLLNQAPPDRNASVCTLQCLTLSKNLLRERERATLHGVNAEECDLLMRQWQSDECREAITAFFLNRRWHWQRQSDREDGTVFCLNRRWPLTLIRLLHRKPNLVLFHNVGVTGMRALSATDSDIILIIILLLIVIWSHQNVFIRLFLNSGPVASHSSLSHAVYTHAHAHAHAHTYQGP